VKAKLNKNLVGNKQLRDQGISGKCRDTY